MAPGSSRNVTIGTTSRPPQARMTRRRISSPARGDGVRRLPRCAGLRSRTNGRVSAGCGQWPANDRRRRWRPLCTCRDQLELLGASLLHTAAYHPATVDNGNLEAALQLFGVHVLEQVAHHDRRPVAVRVDRSRSQDLAEVVHANFIAIRRFEQLTGTFNPFRQRIRINVLALEPRRPGPL